MRSKTYVSVLFVRIDRKGQQIVLGAAGGGCKTKHLRPRP